MAYSDLVIFHCNLVFFGKYVFGEDQMSCF